MGSEKKFDKDSDNSRNNSDNHLSRDDRDVCVFSLNAALFYRLYKDMLILISFLISGS